MLIEIYGKQDCPLCQSAKKKVNHLLTKWDMSNSVRVVFLDMATPQGAAEGDFYDVFDIPAVLLKDARGDAVLSRWDGMAPPGDQLRQRLGA